MKNLFTNGASYSGSHTFLALHTAGFGHVILDNFANTHPMVMERFERDVLSARQTEAG